MGSVKYYTRFAVEIISRLLNYQSGNDCTLAFKKAASVSSSFVPRLSIWTPRSLWLWTNFFGRAKRAADKLVVLGTPRACSLSTRHTLHFHLTCTLHYKRHTAGRGGGGGCVWETRTRSYFSEDAACHSTSQRQPSCEHNRQLEAPMEAEETWCS